MFRRGNKLMYTLLASPMPNLMFRSGGSFQETWMKMSNTPKSLGAPLMCPKILLVLSTCRNLVGRLSYWVSMSQNHMWLAHFYALQNIASTQLVHIHVNERTSSTVSILKHLLHAQTSALFLDACYLLHENETSHLPCLWPAPRRNHESDSYLMSCPPKDWRVAINMSALSVACTSNMLGR